MFPATPSRSNARPRRRSARPGARNLARRLGVTAGVLLVGLVVIAVRLVQLQVVRGDELAEQARRQYQSRIALQAERGSVYDRRGQLLASNSVSLSFAVDPTHVEKPRQLARTFSRVLGDGTADAWFRRITTRDRSFVWLRRKVSGEQMAALREVQDDGLIAVKEPLRRYEYAPLAAQVIGAVDVDNHGLNGVERFYNDSLRGVDGLLTMQRDARGRRRPDVDLPRVDPVHGSSLVLTLDIAMQGIVEEELKRGVEQCGAASGTAVAIDPRTGEILAMASWPSFDPTRPSTATPEASRIRAITDVYEPGSTFKAITASAALEEGVVKVDEMIDGEGGMMRVADHTVRDEHALGLVTVRKAMEQSSNVAFAKIASRLAPHRFYKFIRDFGFGIASGIDLPGEVRGDVARPAQYVEGSQEFMAFGYGLAVTPLQLVSAYAAIANGGMLMRPHLLLRRLDRDGHVIEEVAPQEVRRVVSKEVADSVRSMLVGVVERGTGTEARVSGLTIAGKTGTAQQLVEGEYSRRKYNASFVGFFPAEQPRVALLVLMDSPTHGYYGGQVAAPVFREIARRVAGVAMPPGTPPPGSDSGSNAPQLLRVANTGSVVVPDLRGLDVTAARDMAERYGLRLLASGSGRVVTSQVPAAGASIAAAAVVKVVAPADSTAVMPDLRGMSLRRAASILTSLRVTPLLKGSGVIAEQSIAPNTPLPSGRRVVALVCR